MFRFPRESSFTLGPGVLIDGNCRSRTSPGRQQGTVCGTTVKGNLQVQNNRSPIQIGGGTLQMRRQHGQRKSLTVNNSVTTDRLCNTVGGTCNARNTGVPFTSMKTPSRATSRANAADDSMGATGKRPTGALGTIVQVLARHDSSPVQNETRGCGWLRSLLEAGLAQPVEKVVDTARSR